MIRTRAPLLGLALLLLPACSVAPPVELEQDPAVVATPGDARPPYAGLRLAVAPVAASYLRSSGPAAEGTYGWEKPPLDADALQDHFARLIRHSLGAGTAVAGLGRGSIAPVSSGSLEAATCDAADQMNASLVVHLDVLENRVAWKSRRLALWVPGLVLLWGGGILPVVFFPDEEYEAHVKVRLTVVHSRTRERLFQGEYAGTVEMPLNTFQRGLSISGLIGLHPYFLSAEGGDYEAAHEALFPHALRDLDQKLARALPKALGEALAVPENVKLVHEGTAKTARTYAVVVGHNGPKTTRPRPPLRFAGNDAEVVADTLLRTGVVATKDELRVLSDDGAVRATRADVLAAIDELVGRMLGLDRLVFYYSGYGRTTQAGEPVLVLGGEDDALSVTELAERASRSVLAGRKPRVVFLLDTSFGAEAAGRNYRATDEQASTASPATYLEPLANRSLGWTVIAAAGPQEAAFEIDARSPASRHGFFTQRLLAALTERPDALTTDDLARYLTELVPEDVRAAQQAEQTPEKRGIDEPVLLRAAAPPR